MDVIYLQHIELEDDDSLSGGVSHKGETLAEFIEEHNLWGQSLYQINIQLVICGIKEITLDQIVPKSANKFFDKFSLD